MLEKLLSNKKLIADIILVLVILVICLSALLITNLAKDDGDNGVSDSDNGGSGDGGSQSKPKNKKVAIVLVDGKKIAEYSLAEDGVYHIEGYNGGTNTLVIENGAAYISEASCPQNAGDTACVDQGKKSRVGEVITCLPNRVVVEISGEGEEPIL